MYIKKKMLHYHRGCFSSFFCLVLVLSCCRYPSEAAAMQLKGSRSSSVSIETLEPPVLSTTTATKTSTTTKSNTVTTAAENGNSFLHHLQHRADRHLKKQSSKEPTPAPIPPFTGLCAVFPISVVCAYGNVAISLLSFWNSLGFGNF